MGKGEDPRLEKDEMRCCGEEGIPERNLEMLGCRKGLLSFLIVVAGRGDSTLNGDAEDRGAEDVDGVWSDAVARDCDNRGYNVLEQRTHCNN